tara:strand:+ start:16660 stop:17298 length:639 start_codon:yes stop_codon:yes gene_type:complete
MIYVNIFNITPDQKTIQVSVETTVGYNISSLKLWDNSTYKDTTLAVDLSSKLQQINNKEVFLIYAEDIPDLTEFSGIYFLEIESTAPSEECSTCVTPTLAVTASFANLQNCILNDILNLSICDGDIFSDASCNGNTGITIINKNLLLEALCTALTAGYYEEAIEIYNSLLKLCKIDPNCPNCNTCDACDNIANGSSITGLGYGTLGNTLILS